VRAAGRASRQAGHRFDPLSLIRDIRVIRGFISVLSKRAGVFEHLENFVGEALDFVAEGGGDVVEALVEVAGGGFDVFVDFAGVVAAPGVEGLEFLVECQAEIAFELA